MSAEAPAYEEVLEFWFGKLDESGRADREHATRWFKKDHAFDELIRRRFGKLPAEVANGEHDQWLDSPRGRLAMIIVLDQFSRNMFRGSARMFESDARAQQLALQGVDLGIDKQRAHDPRFFLYMPFVHSEDRSLQARGCQLFSSWRDELSGELQQGVSSGLKYAEQHRDIVQRFGRFPHRNALLGRESTAEELEFLKQPGSSF